MKLLSLLSELCLLYARNTHSLNSLPANSPVLYFSEPLKHFAAGEKTIYPPQGVQRIGTSSYSSKADSPAYQRQKNYEVCLENLWTLKKIGQSGINASSEDVAQC
jgi:hypothetical protein